MSRIIALIINRDNHIPASAVAAVVIHFLPFLAFVSPDHEEKTKNPQYSIYTKATKDNIHSNRLIAI